MISEFPLFVFTTLAGLSAGAYIANAAFPLDKERSMPWAFPLVCLVLLGLGLLGCLSHLMRPTMFLNALANPGAGIAQEAYFSIAYGVLLLVDLIVVAVKKESLRALQIIGALAAFAMTVAMGFAYTGYLAIPAWSTPAIVPLFALGDLAMGFALWALFSEGAYTRATFWLATVFVEVLAAVAFALAAIHFVSVGLSPAPFVVAIVIAPVFVIVLAAMARTREGIILPAAAFACAFVGVCVARWAFYAACTL